MDDIIRLVVLNSFRKYNMHSNMHTSNVATQSDVFYQMHSNPFLFIYKLFERVMRDVFCFVFIFANDRRRWNKCIV